MNNFDRWLQEGSVPEVDWSDHLNRLARAGTLGRAGARWLLDLPALTQPYACVSSACTPGRRAARTDSCCADLIVEVTPSESEAISAATSEVRSHLAPRDRRWAGDVPTWVDGGELTRPSGRCVFAHAGDDGLRCALHEVEDATGRPRGALKPLPCRLFPLVVVDLGEQRRFLTAVHTRTAKRLGHPSARRFPCLRDPNQSPLFEGCSDILQELFGPRAWRAFRQAVDEYLQHAAVPARGGP